MVSAPDTNCMSRQVRPASSSASRAAASPYSTKGRPHLPHSCIAPPLPLTDQVVPALLGVQSVDHQLDLVTHSQVVDRDPRDDLAHDDELLVGPLPGGQAQGHIGL